MSQQNDGRFYANLLIGLVSAGSLTMYLKHQYEAFLINKKRKQVLNTEEFTPTSLFNAIQINSDYIRNKFRNVGSSEDPHRKIVKGRVFLAGLAYSNNPIYSNYFEGIRNIPLIYKVKYSQDVYSLDDTDITKPTYIRDNFPDNAEFHKLSQFSLLDPQTKENNFIYVLLNNDTDIKNCVQYLGSTDKFRWLNLGERLARFFIYLIKMLVVLITGRESPASKAIRGVRLGLRETEVGIKVDSPIVAYGEVIYNFETNTCRMDGPIALTNDKMQYLNRINQQLQEQKWMRNCFGLIFAGTAIYFLRRLFLYEQKKMALKKKEQRIDSIWQIAADTVNEVCPKKLGDMNDADVVQWMEQNEGKEPLRPCKIVPDQYFDYGEPCTKCKKIFLQAQRDVIELEDQYEQIQLNKKNKDDKKDVKQKK
ncbi:hypothetical protein PPERSA_11044 [Pseudocohnilembus persalinus]|uniref:Transmembrane protein n=1 Tax=Pseudocohnilembus persalinus TaxID=266149 RepID=A0A0V0QYX3_PSEPJ|nr:hypothetical protein PPERSA_11044 [Pseudocohnilembus persalinus]|eukprot:KRX07495.1 hypothetical protein PPERSA_11044 [Pseudocohnilembus persalinus]